MRKRILGITIIADVLHYTERTGGEFRDLRRLEINVPRFKRWARISLNGHHRSTKSAKAGTRYANPGWAFGGETVFAEWVHFSRHCAHFSLNARQRGITFSLGKSLV